MPKHIDCSHDSDVLHVVNQPRYRQRCGMLATRDGDETIRAHALWVDCGDRATKFDCNGH